MPPDRPIMKIKFALLFSDEKFYVEDKYECELCLVREGVP